MTCSEYQTEAKVHTPDVSEACSGQCRGWNPNRRLVLHY